MLEEINDFVHCINTRSKPNVDGQAGAKALEIASIENETATAIIVFNVFNINSPLLFVNLLIETK